MMPKHATGRKFRVKLWIPPRHRLGRCCRKTNRVSRRKQYGGGPLRHSEIGPLKECGIALSSFLRVARLASPHRANIQRVGNCPRASSITWTICCGAADSGRQGGADCRGIRRPHQSNSAVEGQFHMRAPLSDGASFSSASPDGPSWYLQFQQNSLGKIRLEYCGSGSAVPMLQSHHGPTIVMTARPTCAAHRAERGKFLFRALNPAQRNFDGWGRIGPRGNFTGGAPSVP